MKSLILFDLDGTLAESTQKVSHDMKYLLKQLKRKYELALVGGSAFDQHCRQIGDDIFIIFDYIFSENGIMAYHKGELIHSNDIRDVILEETMQSLINFVLRYIADLELPKKRGKFIDFRRGLLYITPMGSNCSLNERKEFIEFDKENHIRTNMITELVDRFGDVFEIKLGGQIGLGVYPKGWDKTYCLQHLNLAKYPEIHFFGDRTEPDGNDYCLYVHPRIIGRSVDSPEDTIILIKNLLNQ